MKKTAFMPCFLGVLCLLLIFSCEPSPSPELELTFPTIKVDLPDDIAYGKSLIYLNGEIAENYKPSIRLDTLNGIINYSFGDTTVLDIATRFFFSLVPIEEGQFMVHDQYVPKIGALASFLQLVDEDLDGYSYELVDPQEGWLYIQHLDTDPEALEVKGRFRVKFKRTSTNGNDDLGLPENLQYDGVFYDKIKL